MNPAEDLLAIHLTELGLSFERQFLYAKGRKLRADFVVWRTIWATDKVSIQEGLLVEVVGGIYGRGGKAHGSITGILADLDRLNAATINGFYMLRFTPEQVENGTAKALIEAALKR